MDDGVGIEPSRSAGPAAGHFGLRMMADTAADLGGELRVWSDATGGTMLLLEVPTTGTGSVEPTS